MSNAMKPMLAAKMRPEKDQSIDTLTYPLVVSPKIDGIRCVILDGKALSRALKPIPNKYIQSVLSDPLLDGLDGELMIGDGSSFSSVTTGIMSRSGEPNFTYHVFDDFSEPDYPYYGRVVKYLRRCAALRRRVVKWRGRINPVPVTHVSNPRELRGMVDTFLANGFEGAMVRDKCGRYKFGRATFNEGLLTKIKPLEDAEATIVGFEEQNTNTNAQITNELGRGARSSHKAGMVGKGTLGKFLLTSEEFGDFKCGTGLGLDDALRQRIWDDRDHYLGMLITFTFQRIGMKDKPRIPIFKGFRHEGDIS